MKQKAPFCLPFWGVQLVQWNLHLPFFSWAFLILQMCLQLLGTLKKKQRKPQTTHMYFGRQDRGPQKIMPSSKRSIVRQEVSMVYTFPSYLTRSFNNIKATYKLFLKGSSQNKKSTRSCGRDINNNHAPSLLPFLDCLLFRLLL